LKAGAEEIIVAELIYSWWRGSAWHFVMRWFLAQGVIKSVPPCRVLLCTPLLGRLIYDRQENILSFFRFRWAYFVISKHVIVKSVKYFAVWRNHFTEWCFTETWMGYTEQRGNLLFDTRSRDSVKCETPSIDQYSVERISIVTRVVLEGKTIFSSGFQNSFCVTDKPSCLADTLPSMGTKQSAGVGFITWGYGRVCINSALQSRDIRSQFWPWVLCSRVGILLIAFSSSPFLQIVGRMLRQFVKVIKKSQNILRSLIETLIRMW